MLKVKGVTRFHCVGDLMHAGDLGVCLWLLGVLAELIHGARYQGALEKRMEGLWGDILAKYRELGAKKN
eukprot:12553178-Alexandrium_andersonii.AAC.1